MFSGGLQNAAYICEGELMHDEKCDVLGRYCWTHKMQTEAGIPGWPVTAKTEEFVRHSPWDSKDSVGFTESILWANGDTETPKDNYTCILCANNVCPRPVLRGVEYHEVVTKKSYWNWLESNSSFDEETSNLREPVAANPDALGAV